jgi:cobalt-zinc-cadmium efflux system membrane fusion protein
MQTTARRRKILLVDDDEVLLQVLSRVLAKVGYEVVRTTTVADALQQADCAPDVGLIDLSLPDGDGMDLARALHKRLPGLPLILMTAYPTRLRDPLDLDSEFVHVLTKPMDLQQLQQVLNDVLPGQQDREPATAAKAPAVTRTDPSEAPSHRPPTPVSHHSASASSRLKTLRSILATSLVVLILVLFLGFAAGVPFPGLASAHNEETVTAPPGPATGAELVKDRPHTLRVPEEVRIALGICKAKGDKDRVWEAREPTTTKPLVLSGSTALDPTRLMRIRARFAPCEVVQIGQVPEPPDRTRSGQTEFRQLRSGDHVKKGDLLGVFHSVDVGQKKNDLIDALVQLKLDEEILDRADKSSHALPAVALLNFQRNVETDRNAVARAQNTLKTWGIPKEDLDAVYKEAEEISKRKGKRDQDKQDQWARVELRAPDDGIIVERNVSLHEMVVDNTINLFQIAKVDRLVVVANAPEDDLPTLLSLPPRLKNWTVRPLAEQRAGGTGSQAIKGTIDEISQLIDVNQHNAVVKGHIDNPGDRLRAGQFVSCSIQLPPPKDVVEVPISAIVDDGRQCVVFVQEDPAKPEYTLRRVEVSQRFEKTALVRSRLKKKETELTPEEKEQELLAREPLRPGERVLRTGVLELKRELEDQESKQIEGKN